jgi:hypothetical protein
VVEVRGLVFNTEFHGVWHGVSQIFFGFFDVLGTFLTQSFFEFGTEFLRVFWLDGIC